MLCAANNASTPSKETSHGIDTDYRRVSAAVWRRRRILGSKPRLLVTGRCCFRPGGVIRRRRQVHKANETTAKFGRSFTRTAV
jgi:hypothetical protein